MYIEYVLFSLHSLHLSRQKLKPQAVNQCYFNITDILLLIFSN